ncbi:MAG TPA: HAMP domain-containing sensor histidine kinase [Gaiellaceae bacterium]|nr:HAMP domain-containing sensor histidine kinase [Gaiellaceae bacterium]
MTRRPLESWISIVRLLAVPFAVLQVTLTKNYPSGYEPIAWLLTAALAVAAVVLYATVRDSRSYRFLAMALDFGIVAGFTILFGFEFGTPTRQLLFLAIVVGAVRFGMRGGIVVALAAVPVAALFEQQRAHWFHVRYRIEYVTFQAGAGLLMALLVGWVVTRLDEQRATAEQRAEEAEALRDELGRRADLLDAANRCARALSSSLDLDEAVNAFIRELRGLVPFDRMAIVLAEEGTARMIATAGEQAGGAMSAGAEFSPENSLISDVVARGQTIYRRDMSEPLYVEEDELLALGLRSRVAAPLLAGARPIGLLSLSRREPDAFQEHEIELAGLLGRLAASAVQNIRSYESERRTVDELRRLSALRADFVSLVSHELRSPMAAVIGAARTLQARWRELQPEQRESFLALIGDETTRLAALIGDVLDTSRIDAGTFSYRFGDVDVAALVRDTVAMAAVGQDEVPIVAEVAPGVPVVRGDPERLRQIFGNLIDNAVKYSPTGEAVEVHVSQANGSVLVSVRDRGPGIKAEDQRVIFEKFGRVAAGNTKPGSGLGLYIARSIAETHGGTIAVSSALGRGSTFTVKLPA